MKLYLVTFWSHFSVLFENLQIGHSEKMWKIHKQTQSENIDENGFIWYLFVGQNVYGDLNEVGLDGVGEKCLTISHWKKKVPISVWVLEGLWKHT